MLARCAQPAAQSAARDAADQPRGSAGYRGADPLGWFALVVLCMALAPAVLPAQTSTRLRARVVDERNGAAIPGAAVSIVGVAGSVITDGDGRFSWDPVPTRRFVVVVVLPGGQVMKPVTIEGPAEDVIVVRVNALAEESVTVLGVAPSVTAAPASARTTLSATQINRRNPETLMQALETVPGINQVSEGHAGVPAVRGLARGRTLLLIDGGRVTAERRVGPSATFLDPSTVDGIDIARGPGSVAYGSDALGGVVSIRTRHAEPRTPFRTRFTGTFGVGVPEARGTVEVSKGLDRGGVLVQARVRNAGDYDAPSGEVFNSGWQDKGVLMHVTQAIGRGTFSSAWQSDFGRDFERPRNNSSTVRFYYPFENSHRFTTSYAMPGVAGFRQIAFSGFVGTYEQRIDQDRFATATTGRSIERADVSANDFHVKGSADRLVGAARVEFGVDVNGRYGLEALDIIQTYDLAGRLTRDTTNVSVEDAHRIDAGTYVQAEAGVGRITRVSAGVRADRVTTTNVGGFFGDRSTSNAAGSGFGAISIDPFQGFGVTAQVSRGFRDPVLSDRYFRGPSGRGFITGNPGLQPETTVQFDLATRYSLPRVELAAYFYQYRINDLIERYTTQTDFFFFRNRGRARLRGVELEARSDLGNGYTVEVGAQFARGQALDDNANLDDVSPASLSFLGKKQFGNLFYTQARIAFYAEDNRPGPSEVVAPGATLLDIGAGWRVAPQLEVRGMIRNMLDDSYYASPDPRWVYAPGRSASVTIATRF
jgi:outer membrane receptor protein involved in Fe transport